jgi:hypothetical protein
MMRMRATSFADAEDLRRYNRAIQQGKSSPQALEVGDNGLGAWGQSTVAGTGPCVALSPTVVGFFKGGMVRVVFGEKSVDCDVRDIAPEGVIDLNPDACEALGLNPPVSTMVDWFWL